MASDNSIRFFLNSIDQPHLWLQCVQTVLTVVDDFLVIVSLRVFWNFLKINRFSVEFFLKLTLKFFGEKFWKTKKILGLKWIKNNFLQGGSIKSIPIFDFKNFLFQIVLYKWKWPKFTIFSKRTYFRTTSTNFLASMVLYQILSQFFTAPLSKLKIELKLLWWWL